MRKKTDTKNDDSFLSRWSDEKSRKQNPLVEVPAIDDTHLSDTDESQSGLETDDQHSKQSPDEIPELTDEDMPDIETLDEKSDFSGFLSPGVSDELQKLALRKLFRSKVFNVRDGLDDYDDDFRSFAALGDIITSDMKHQMELAEERKRQAEEEKQAQQRQAQEKQTQEEHAIKEEQECKDQEDADMQEQDSDDQLAMQDNSETEDQIQENETSENKPNAKQSKQIAGKKIG